MNSTKWYSAAVHSIKGGGVIKHKMKGFAAPGCLALTKAPSLAENIHWGLVEI